MILVEDMSMNAIKGQQTDLIMLDFNKAFDKDSHRKFLLLLHHYGIRGRVLRAGSGRFCRTGHRLSS